MTVQLTVDGAIATLLFDSPERHNALSPEDRYESARLLNDVRHDDSVRALVLTGSGASFCAGAHVGQMGNDGLFAARARMERGVHAMVQAIAAMPKPVVAAVRGHALGMGWSLALACDVVIASETAKFSTLFLKRGLVPDGGAVHMLSRAIGDLRAKELAFSSRTMEAAEALSLGLVTRVVADGDLESDTAATAKQLSEGPTQAYAFTKQLFRVAPTVTFERYLEVEAMLQPQLNQSHDHHEGIAAFKERREPHFRGE